MCFHLSIAEASHNLVLLQTMRGFFDLLQSSVKQSRQRMYQVPPVFTQLTGQHREIMDAIFAGDAGSAREAMMAHLGFVHTTIRQFDEDQARRARITACPTNDPRFLLEIKHDHFRRQRLPRCRPTHSALSSSTTSTVVLTQYTLRRNVEDLGQVALRQRVLKNMSALSTETTLFGEKLSMPVALAPVGLCGMYARRGSPGCRGGGRQRHSVYLIDRFCLSD
jgi:hypothetical protein